MPEHCPKCQAKLTLNGVYKGRQRTRCRACGYSCTEGGSVAGSLPKYGDAAQTGADRARRCRENKKGENKLRHENLRIGHACDRAAFEQPLQFAIAQIVGQLPPFPFDNARIFAELPIDTQGKIEDWCSNAIARTQYGYWMTGSSVVDAAETLVRLAEESGNIGSKTA